MGFAVGRYEPTRPLVIDPVLAFSTYWGGDRDEEGQDLAVDAAGRAYVTGMTFSDDFPITADAFQPTYNYLWDVFVAVLSADGSSLLFSSYLGGGHWDASTGIVLDAAGRYAYVTGFTRSGDFPTKDPVQPSHDGTRGDAFVAKISTNLSADLIVSALAAPSTARAGTGITVTDTTKNRGGGRARASTTTVYLSTNKTVDAADVVLGSRAIPPWRPGPLAPARSPSPSLQGRPPAPIISSPAPMRRRSCGRRTKAITARPRRSPFSNRRQLQGSGQRVPTRSGDLCPVCSGGCWWL